MKIGTGSTAKILRFSYDAGGNVVAVDYSSNNGSSFATYYYLRNAQNDIVKIVDNSGASKVEYTYDSWGKIISATGTLTATLGTDQPFRYRGYVYDTETGWYYLQSRYYNPAVCRFISADVLLSTGQGVIGHNAFAYCLNNPVNGIDSNGQYFRSVNGQMTDTGSYNPAHAEYMLNKYKYVSAMQPIKKAIKAVSNAVGSYFTNDPDVVVTRIQQGKIATVYRGTLMLTFTDAQMNSFTPGPFVMLNTRDVDATTVMHEYGHSVQWKLLGTKKYLFSIAFPSVAVWLYDKNVKSIG